MSTTPSPLTTQIGGTHYKTMAIQPVEFIHRNGLGYLVGNVIKYVCRYRAKNGNEDLLKAKHYLELLIAEEYPEEPRTTHTVEHAGCRCWACLKTVDVTPLTHGFIACQTCGNKRCPHCENHRYKCTGSNNLGQVGELEIPGDQ